MIKNLFVPYEIALALKAKGFTGEDFIRVGFYIRANNGKVKATTQDDWGTNNNDNKLTPVNPLLFAPLIPTSN